jgi:Tol biopolymer transport system component/DNA-binding winged helix-turn-helix (wHTH) protein
MNSPEPSGAASADGPAEVFAFGEFKADVSSGELTKGNSPVLLPSRAFDTLVLLIRNRHRIVGKNEIVDSIWPDVIVTDDSLVNVVSVLRRALGDDLRNPTYIKTFPRRGYRFVAPAIAEKERPARRTESSRSRRSSATVLHRLMKHFPKTLQRPYVISTVLTLVFVFIFFGTGGITELPADFGDAGAVRFSQSSPNATTLVSGGEVSPDTRHIAFLARDDRSAETMLWIRTLASGNVTKLAGTAGARRPFWSPDSKKIGFFADGKLLYASLSGGEPRLIADVEIPPSGASWGPDDQILFAAYAGGINRVSASGDGLITHVMKLDRSNMDIAITSPQFLPDGRHFLYHLLNLDPARTGTYVRDIVTGDTARVFDAESPMVYTPPGYLLHVSNGMLIAEEFDPNRLELTNRARIVARNVAQPSHEADSALSATENLLVFQDGSRGQELSWVSRTGERAREFRLPAFVHNPRLSPDQSQVLATGSQTSDAGLWLARMDRQEYVMLESDATTPLWAPNGKSIAFSSRNGFDVIVRPLDNRSRSRRVLSDATVKVLNDWSPDGAQIIYTRAEEASLDVWATDINTGETEPLIVTQANEMQARISPDGHWLAFASDESGVLEVYVQPLRSAIDRRKVSVGGGGQPQWRADQRELFYLSANRTIMSVVVQSSASGMEFESPQTVIWEPLDRDAEDARDTYAASADGTHFLIDHSTHLDGGREISIVLNWTNGTLFHPPLELNSDSEPAIEHYY